MDTGFDEIKKAAKTAIIEVLQSDAFKSEEISDKGRWAYLRASNAIESGTLVDLFEALDSLLNCPDIVSEFADPHTQEAAVKAEEMRGQVWACLLH